MTGLIETGDGSATLFLDEYEQAMHSSSGAYEEAVLKHVIPSGILLKEKKELYVLDVGFGLGYNVLALVQLYSLSGSRFRLKIISLEKDKSFSFYMDSVVFNDERDSLYSIIKKGYSQGSVQWGDFSLSLIFGDARESLKQLKEYRFDAVFQDPFSPAKNPELWSVEYFELIARVMEHDAVLTTYSSADHVRKAMIEAGLVVGKGPAVGQKREGTLASPGNFVPVLEKDRLEKIRNNPKSEPYRDPELNLTREEIITNRLESISKKKKLKDIIKFI